MNKIFSAVAFAVGAAAGVAAAWAYAKKRYERIAQEEIDSVKEAFSRKEARRKKEEESREDTNDGYSEEKTDKKVARTIRQPEGPYVITPEDFGTRDDYETVSLIYYADHVLADEEGVPVRDVAASVGTAALSRFGEYEDDSVFVRNDRLRCDYEILMDYRKHSDLPQERRRKARDD